VVEEALEMYGSPEIFNTDQGSQFTSAEFTSLLEAKGIRISMDGKGSGDRQHFCGATLEERQV
jgi:putative transposase